MACNNGVCCPGTNIPAESVISCRNGRWQCQPSLARCPSVETDAGHPADAQVSTDASATDADDAETRPLSFGLWFDGPASQGYAPGTQGAYMMRFRVRFEEEVELRSLGVTLEAQTTSDRIVSTNRQLVASSIRLLSLENGATILGPLPIRPDDVTSTLAAVTGRLQGGGMRLEAGREYAFAVLVSLPERVDPELFGRGFRIRLGENGFIFGGQSLYRVVRGEYFAGNPAGWGTPPELVGNLMRIEQPRVAVSLADFESQQTVTRNNLSMHLLRVRYSSLGNAPVFPIRVQYTGVAELGAGYRTQNFSRAVVACGHNCDENGATPRMSPTSDGRMTFERFTGPIANSSRTCSIICSTDSVVDGRDGDRIALGIANASDVAFEDQYGNPALVDLDDRLQRQLSAPTHTVTVVHNGMLWISANSVPDVDLVGTEYGWVRVASYALHLAYEDATLRRVGVRVTGNARCVREIQVRTPTAIVGRGTIPQGMTTTDIETLDPPLGLGTTELVIEARLSPTVDPRVDPNGCHVGDTVAFALNYGDNSWGSPYTTATNLLAVGTVSGAYLTYGGPSGPGATVTLR